MSQVLHSRTTSGRSGIHSSVSSLSHFAAVADTNIAFGIGADGNALAGTDHDGEVIVMQYGDDTTAATAAISGAAGVNSLGSSRLRQGPPPSLFSPIRANPLPNSAAVVCNAHHDDVVGSMSAGSALCPVAAAAATLASPVPLLPSVQQWQVGRKASCESMPTQTPGGSPMLRAYQQQPPAPLNPTAMTGTTIGVGMAATRLPNPTAAKSTATAKIKSTASTTTTTRGTPFKGIHKVVSDDRFTPSNKGDDSTTSVAVSSTMHTPTAPAAVAGGSGSGPLGAPANSASGSYLAAVVAGGRRFAAGSPNARADRTTTMRQPLSAAGSPLAREGSDNSDGFGGSDVILGLADLSICRSTREMGADTPTSIVDVAAEGGMYPHYHTHSLGGSNSPQQLQGGGYMRRHYTTGGGGATTTASGSNGTPHDDDLESHASSFLQAFVPLSTNQLRDLATMNGSLGAVAAAAAAAGNSAVVGGGVDNHHHTTRHSVGPIANPAGFPSVTSFSRVASNQSLPFDFVDDTHSAAHSFADFGDEFEAEGIHHGIGNATLFRERAYSEASTLGDSVQAQDADDHDDSSAAGMDIDIVGGGAMIPSPPDGLVGTAAVGVGNAIATPNIPNSGNASPIGPMDASTASSTVLAARKASAQPTSAADAEALAINNSSPHLLVLPRSAPDYLMMRVFGRLAGLGRIGGGAHHTFASAATAGLGGSSRVPTSLAGGHHDTNNGSRANGQGASNTGGGGATQFPFTGGLGGGFTGLQVASILATLALHKRFPNGFPDQLMEQIEGRLAQSSSSPPLKSLLVTRSLTSNNGYTNTNGGGGGNGNNAGGGGASSNTNTTGSTPIPTPTDEDGKGVAKRSSHNNSSTAGIALSSPKSNTSRRSNLFTVQKTATNTTTMVHHHTLSPKRLPLPRVSSSGSGAGGGAFRSGCNTPNSGPLMMMPAGAQNSSGAGDATPSPSTGSTSGSMSKRSSNQWVYQWDACDGGASEATSFDVVSNVAPSPSRAAVAAAGGLFTSQSLGSTPSRPPQSSASNKRALPKIDSLDSWATVGSGHHHTNNTAAVAAPPPANNKVDHDDNDPSDSESSLECSLGRGTVLMPVVVEGRASKKGRKAPSVAVLPPTTNASKKTLKHHSHHKQMRANTNTATTAVVPNSISSRGSPQLKPQATPPPASSSTAVVSSAMSINPYKRGRGLPTSTLHHHQHQPLPMRVGRTSVIIPQDTPIVQVAYHDLVEDDDSSCASEDEVDV